MSDAQTHRPQGSVPVALAQLILQASTELGSQACGHGKHQWQSVGGRGCPHPEEIGSGRCSQTVYQCSVCDGWDYGEPGGPGHADCMDCMHKWRATDHSWWFDGGRTKSGRDAATAETGAAA